MRDEMQIVEENFDRIFNNIKQTNVTHYTTGGVRVHFSHTESYELTPACVCALIRSRDQLHHVRIVHDHLMCGYETAQKIMNIMYAK